MNELENKIEQLEKYIEVKEQECNELQEKIKEAIEYIESRHIKAGVVLTPREKELLDILKGE